MITNISIDKLHQHPDNPRKDLGDLSELSDSIMLNGVLQNLTVVPWFSEITHAPCDDPKQQEEMGYRVVIGHRRLAAAKMAGLTELPCAIVEMDYRQQVATMLLENMQRTDLTVYEQARGFQMMLDFGETVDSISDKTGFSETTVRRRLKMAELDQGVLREVATRQVSLMDFDKLAQIDDIDARNEALKSIGLPDFNQSIETRIRKQNISKHMPAIKTGIKRLSGKKITWSETYGGKYDEIGKAIDIKEWNDEDPLVAETETRKLFYLLDEDRGILRFYVERERAKPVKKSAKEIEREHQITEAWETAKEKAELFYKLRSDFVSGVKLTKKNADAMLTGAVTAGTLRLLTYVPGSSTSAYKVLGIDCSTYSQKFIGEAVDSVQHASDKAVADIIYLMFGDTSDNDYIQGWKQQFPQYDKNDKLDGLYAWLVSLGYELSDEERTMKDGTHELFHLDDHPADSEETDDAAGQV